MRTWIDLAEGRDMWQAFVNVVMNIPICKMWGIFLLAEELLAFQEELSSMELVGYS
jgi:hypothetical protein